MSSQLRKLCKSFFTLAAALVAFSLVVKAQIANAPFVADQITEHVQTFADGTQTVNPTQRVTLYRDSAGRTRTECFVTPLGVSANAKVFSVELMDPVAGYRYMIDQQNHTVHRKPWPPATKQPPSRPISRIGHLSTGQTFVIATFDASSAPPRPKPTVLHQALGTRPIEGVNAEGTRDTVTYPEHFIGNDRPLTIVYEKWTSPELKMDLIATTFDPRNGDTTVKLVNISRSESNPVLFEIPSDYSVVDDPLPRSK